LCTNLALFTRLYKDARPTKYKKLTQIFFSTRQTFFQRTFTNSEFVIANIRQFFVENVFIHDHNFIKIIIMYMSPSRKTAGATSVTTFIIFFTCSPLAQDFVQTCLLRYNLCDHLVYDSSRISSTNTFSRTLLCQTHPDFILIWHTYIYTYIYIYIYSKYGMKCK
jgi:hypothetical protein